jgi:hypothetical protein
LEFQACPSKTTNFQGNPEEINLFIVEFQSYVEKHTFPRVVD